MNVEKTVEFYTAAAPDLRFRWNGAHTVNVFCDEVEVDVFTCGDFAEDAATEDEVRAAVSRYVSDLYR